MKITTTDGNITTTHDFQDMEEYRDYLRIKAELGQTVEITDLGDSVMAAMTSPPVPPLTAPVAASTQDDDPARLAPTAKVRRDRIPNPPEVEGRWPDLIYLTDVWNKVYEVLKVNPEGLTSHEIGILLETDMATASGWALRLREATPLVERVGRVHRLTQIGLDETLSVRINNINPGRFNKSLGWQRFVARTLRDGSQSKHRRSR